MDTTAVEASPSPSPSVTPARGHPPRKPLRTRKGTDRDAREVIFITIPNGLGDTVKMLPEDFEKLRAEGWTHGWVFASNGHGRRYVVCNKPGEGRGTCTIAGLIAKPGRGKQVRFKDGDPRNLRSDNLTVVRRLFSAP